MVYVARNPKDVAVSFYYHHKLLRGVSYTGDLETFVKYFMKNMSNNSSRRQLFCFLIQLIIIFCYTAYFSPYFPHVLDAWLKREHPNLLFLFYEDMKRVNWLSLDFCDLSDWFEYYNSGQDLKGEIEKVAKFLGKPLTENQILKLREHLRVDNFAKNDSVNFEIGKKVGFMNDTELRFVRKGTYARYLCGLDWNLTL